MPERAMKFFVPYADGEARAEKVWAAVRTYLAGLGLPTTGRRIRALGMTIAGKDHFLAVGGETPDGEDFVMVILEASNLDLFEACPEPGRRISTPTRGMVDDIPYPMALDDERWRVIVDQQKALPLTLAPPRSLPYIRVYPKEAPHGRA